MAITTSNTAGNEALVVLLHEYYSVGERITDYMAEYGISNTVLNGVCAEIKGTRSGVNVKKANTTHIAILNLLGTN